MAIKIESLYRKVFDDLNSKGFNPVPKDAQTGKDTVPEEADYLEFDLDTGEGVIPVSLSVEKINDRFNLVVYMDDSAYKSTADITNLLPKLRYTAQNLGIHGFTVKNRDHLAHDQKKRMYMKKQEQIAEGYYPLGKKASYTDAVPSVKIILQHTRQIEEGEQRYRNIAKIFLENEHGERFMAPTTKPGIARVYARHIAEGGVPNDDRWNHIKGLCEEYNKMAGFVRATKSGQFTESAQKLVNEGIGHYQNLRETLSKMAGHRGYNAYFESWTPSLMEDDTDTSNLNELFVQETVDPRIESVMPILSRLQKKISEMSEVNELSEWADKIIESGDETEIVEGLDSEKRAKLDDLIDKYQTATDPEYDYYGVDDHYDADDVITQIRSEFGDKIASQVEAGTEKMHFGRHKIQRSDPLAWKKPVDRITKAGKMYKQDSDFRKNTIKSRYELGGKSATEGVEEGLGDIAKKVGGAIKTGAKKALDVVAPDDEQLLKQLRKDIGLKPSMAEPNRKLDEMPDTQFHEEAIEEGHVDVGQMMAKDGIKYDPKKEKELINLMADYMKKAGMSSKEINYLLSYNEDYIPDQLQYLPREGVTEGGMPSNVVKVKQHYAKMSPKEFAQSTKERSDDQLRAMAQRHGYGEGSDHYVDKRNAGKEGVAEAGILKSIKRGLKGWGGIEDDPKTLVKRNKEHDDDTVKMLAKGEPGTTGSPRDLQKRVLDREMKKRGLGEEGVAEGLGKDLKRLATGKDVKSRAGQEIAKSQQASMTGDNKTAYKHFKRYDKLDKLANEDQGVAEDLSPEQKRVGQLGPTEKVGPKGAVGKLVGAESAEPKDNMLEGQEDLDAMLRLLRK